MYIDCFISEKEEESGERTEYYVIRENNDFSIECRRCGTGETETAYLGSCGEKKAENAARLFALGALRPVHIKEVVTDMRF